jgi:hypothetical protein
VVTADGHAISVSDDRTLKVWDLDTYTCLLTHRDDVAYTAVAATATTIVAGDNAGAVWVLDRPPPKSSAKGLCTTRASQRRSHVDEPASRRPLKKRTILFLAADPGGIDQLALDRQARAIRLELERSGYRDRFQFATRWAAEPLDLLRELRKLKPTVVHFSGHGAWSADHRLGPAPHCQAGEPRQGLFFHGADGRAQLVSTAALEQTFGAAGASVKLVVLSGCYSEAWAAALLAHVDCVVGVGGSLCAAAARSFAIGFYGGLGEGESVAAAYAQGCAAISLEGLPDHDRPQLKVRPGVDATQLVPATGPG